MAVVAVSLVRVRGGAADVLDARRSLGRATTEMDDTLRGMAEVRAYDAQGRIRFLSLTMASAIWTEPDAGA